MSGAFKLVRIKGIQLFVHWTFLFLIGWVLLVNVRRGNDWEQLAWSVLFILSVFACVALHEFGHALMAARFGIRARNIILLPIGGIASIEKFPGNPRQELAISLAGPLVNLLIAGVLVVFLVPVHFIWQTPADASITHGHDFLYNLYAVNIALAAFNLIPAFPMDGGRVLRALLGLKLNYVRATAIAATIGKVVAGFIVAAGIVLFSPVLVIIGVFIIFSAGAEEHYLRLKALVQGIKIKEVLMYDYNSLESKTTVKEAASVLMSNHSKYFIVMDGPHPAGSINRIEIIKAIAEMKYGMPVKDLLRKELCWLDGDKELDTVLEKLAANDERIYPVMENGRFTGVINFNQIIEYLLIHKADTKEYNRIKSLTGLL
ncbi:MAG TPA: site-2 protease family protein [Chitinophagaceae bacterium]|nr:site-2 protease family protein [Chitinophagaceae bacterium]